MEQHTCETPEIPANAAGTFSGFAVKPNCTKISATPRQDPGADEPVCESRFAAFACSVAEATELQSQVTGVLADRLLALERAVEQSTRSTSVQPADKVKLLSFAAAAMREVPDPALAVEPPVYAPTDAFLEVTSHCNMHCVFCPSDDLTRSKQHISDAAARKYIRAIPALLGTRHLWLHCMGEPLLNPRVFEYMDLCDEVGISPTLITNGTLLTEENLRKLYSHRQASLVISLHTPTQDSFAARGCPSVKTFEEYKKLIFRAIEAKFKHGNRKVLHLCLATETFENPECAGSPHLWTLFPDIDEYKRALKSFFAELSGLAAEMKRKYPLQYEEEWQTAIADAHTEIENGAVTLDPEKLPGPAHGARAGWMPLPNVFVMRKPFGIWSSNRFIRRRLPAGKFSYIEDREEPYSCDFGKTQMILLSNGEYSTCCRDANGEMDLGNINTLEPADFMRSKRLANLMANFSQASICRRCKGRCFVLDTEPLTHGTQTIDAFGAGFYNFDPELLKRGGRWTNGKAYAYFFTRVNAWEVSIDYYSPLPAGAKCEVILERLADPDNHAFITDVRFEFETAENCISRLVVPANLTREAFYRITLVSPSIPASGHQLGLAVLDAKLHGQPLTALPARHEAGEIVQLG
jgi:sulfatase maturation enzyme AslB (radical SAM superfamily)